MLSASHCSSKEDLDAEIGEVLKNKDSHKTLQLDSGISRYALDQHIAHATFFRTFAFADCIVVRLVVNKGEVGCCGWCERKKRVGRFMPEARYFGLGRSS
jgi:hypothetical protein